MAELERTSPVELIGGDPTGWVTARDVYGDFHDVDDGTVITVNRRRDNVSIAISGEAVFTHHGEINLTPFHAARCAAAIVAAAGDAINWREQNL